MSSSSRPDGRDPDPGDQRRSDGSAPNGDARGDEGPEIYPEGSLDAEYQSHAAVNTDRACPVCGIRALHTQHCKELCLACGWYRSCVD